ncbi:MAG: lysostaphin resistance A-like protein, partial [Vampirovibrionia bacterium]
WKIWDAVYIIIFTFFVGLLIAALLNYFNVDRTNTLIFGLIQIIIPIISISCVLFCVKYIYKQPILESLGLVITRENLYKYIKAGVIISILIYFSSLIISLISINITGEPLENPYKDFDYEQIKMISIIAILIAPLIEEIFFRGFMQPAACQAIGDIPGVLIVSAVFALSHQQYMQYPAAIAIILSLSLILGFSRLYFKSTVPGIIGHLLNNIYATLWIFAGQYG